MDVNLRRGAPLLLQLSSLILGSSCASDLDDAALSDPAAEQRAEDERAFDEASADGAATLALGSQGEAVVRAYDYLRRFGYFPNEELARKYPGFEPLVDSAPSDPAVFDENLERAVKVFQARNALPATGVIDADTRDAMVEDRCGHPDGYGHAHHGREVGDDLGDEGTAKPKFAALPGWTTQSFSWSLENWPSGQTESSVVALLTQAFSVWTAIYDSSFPRVAKGTGTIKISFAYIDGTAQDFNGDNVCDDNCVLGFAGGPQILFDKDDAFVFSGNLSGFKADFLSIAIHEIGHKLGFEHSSNPDSIMFPRYDRGTIKRTLTAEDRLGVRAAFGVWGTVAVPEPVVDVGIGVSSTGTTGFFIVTDQKRIYKYASGAWTQVPGEALAIAADARGRPWIVGANNKISVRNQTNTAWTQLASCAQDVSVGADLVAFVGCNGTPYLHTTITPGAADATLNSQIASGQFTAGPLPSGRLAVRVGALARGWMPLMATDNQGALWVNFLGAWLPSAVPPQNMYFNDISLGGAIWTAARASGQTASRPYVHNNQAKIEDYIPGEEEKGLQVIAPERNQWLGAPQAPTGINRIASTHDGRPYAVGAGKLWTTTK